MSLTARRERLPSGRSNLNSARDPPSQSSPTQLPQLSPSSQSPPESMRMTASTSELLHTSKAAVSEIYRERQALTASARAAFHHHRSKTLGEYNEFSVPRKSAILPLRTVFLDPAVNNFPKSKTRSELLERIKRSGIPDISFDIDGDGFVSQADYKLSKTYDLDNNGVLEQDELVFGKEMSAHLRTLENARKKKEILECLTLPPKALLLTQHNFFTNKLDPSAWNDFDAIPRSASDFGGNHGGSRKRLVFSRTLADRMTSQSLLDRAYSLQEVYDNRRTNQITDVAYENS